MLRQWAASAKSPIVLRTALAVVEAAAASPLSSADRRAEAGHEVMNPDRASHDIFTDGADRAGGLTSAAVRIARSVSLRPNGDGGWRCEPFLSGGGRILCTITSPATGQREGPAEANGPGRDQAETDNRERAEPHGRSVAGASRLSKQCGTDLPLCQRSRSWPRWDRNAARTPAWQRPVRFPGGSCLPVAGASSPVRNRPGPFVVPRGEGGGQASTKDLSSVLRRRHTDGIAAVTAPLDRRTCARCPFDGASR